MPQFYAPPQGHRRRRKKLDKEHQRGKFNCLDFTPPPAGVSFGEPPNEPILCENDGKDKNNPSPKLQSLIDVGLLSSKKTSDQVSAIAAVAASTPKQVGKRSSRKGAPLTKSSAKTVTGSGDNSSTSTKQCRRTIIKKRISSTKKSTTRTQSCRGISRSFRSPLLPPGSSRGTTDGSCIPSARATESSTNCPPPKDIMCADKPSPTAIQLIELSHLALAFDTRTVLNPKHDDQPSFDPSPAFRDYWNVLNNRGAPPHRLVATVPDANHKANLTSSDTVHGDIATIKSNSSSILVGTPFWPGIRVSDISTCTTDSMISQELGAAPVKTSEISSTATNRMLDSESSSTATTTPSAIPIPLGLTAEHSWSIFGEMVVATTGRDSSKAPSRNGLMDLTILTTDVALFCDTNTSAHKLHAAKFASKVEFLFEKSLLGSISIVVMTSTSDDSHIDFVQPKNPSSDAKNCSTTEVANGGNNMDIDGCVDDEKNGRDVVILNCANGIRATLEEYEWDASSNKGSGTRLNISFRTQKGNVIDYQQLSRRWIREALEVRRLSSRMRFSLPETMDATQCSIYFDVKYQIFPSKVNAIQSQLLLAELDKFQSTRFDVIQLVPILSIDASLFYGCPMIVHAGLERDFAQYQEMKVLVGSMFRLLQERNIAILIRGTSQASNDSTDDEQLFLLMAQELPSGLKAAPPSGLLFRIAHANQLLAEAAEVCVNEGEDVAEMEVQYTNYLEEALGQVEQKAYNPLEFCNIKPPTAEPILEVMPAIFHDATEIEKQEEIESKDRTSDVLPAETPREKLKVNSDDENFFSDDDYQTPTPSSPQPEIENTLWSDAVGVGALGPKQDFSQTQDDEAMEENE